MEKNKTKTRNSQFIKTLDLETARKLRSLGFTELTEESSTCYCFLNDGKMTFDAESNGCVYTNILCI